MEAHRDAVIQELRGYFSDGSSYGVLSQRKHALQAARQAEMAGAPTAIVVGALIHDVGWKLARMTSSEDAKGLEMDSFEGGASAAAPTSGCVAEQLGILAHCGLGEAGAAPSMESVRAQHDVIGAAWARMMGFEETVAHVIEGHVLAKRYLCFREADYHAKLSEGSKRTLVFQGGPMDAAEAALFEQDPLFEACTEMRRWDEGAKEPHWEVPDFDAYEQRVRECIVAQRATAPPASKTYVREGNTIVGLAEAHQGATVAWRPAAPAVPALRSPQQTALSARWARDGYIVLRCDEWLEPGTAEKLQAWADEVKAFRPQGAEGGNPEALRPALPEGQATWGPFQAYEQCAAGVDVQPSRTEAFVDHHAGLHGFLRGPDSPLMAVVAHLAEEPVRMYKDKLNYKAPGGGGYVPHQDFYTGLGVPQYKSPEDRGFLTYVCMIAVDESTLANGCAQVAPNTWRRKEGWLDNPRAGDGDVGDSDWEHMGPFTPVEMKPGDLLIYDNFMPHKSHKNTTDSWRRALFGIYYGADTNTRNLRQEYYEHEAQVRRNPKTGDGKANRFHTGVPIKLAV